MPACIWALWCSLAPTVVRNSDFWGPMQLRLMWVKTKLHRMNEGAHGTLLESTFYQVVPFIRLWPKAGWRPLQAGSCGQSKECPALPQHRTVEISNPAFSLMSGGPSCYYYKIHIPTRAHAFVPAFSVPVIDTIFIILHWCWRLLHLIYWHLLFLQPRALWVTYQKVRSLLMVTVNTEPEA